MKKGGGSTGLGARNYLLHPQRSTTLTTPYLTFQLKSTPLLHIKPSQWSGIPGHPVTPKQPPPTAAASHQTEQAAHAAGKAGISSSPAWTKTIFWTASKKTARHDRSAPKRLRSSRKRVQRAGYVDSPSSLGAFYFQC